MSIFQFMSESPILGFIMMCFVYYIIKHLFYYLPKRYLRHLDIKKNGWPKNDLMDADGDIVYPEVEE